MQEEHSIIGKILGKYPDLLEEEKQVFNEWLAKEGNQQKFNLLIDNETRIADLNQFFEIRKTKDANRKKYHQAIKKLQTKTKVVWWNKWQTYVAAASIIAIVSVVTFRWLGEKKNIQGTVPPTTAKVNDIPPGQFKAKLTLDDNSVIVLDNVSGKVVQQGGTTVIYKDGKLVYQQKGKENKIFYNTLSTSKGETFATVLSDGTKVWLNSQSSIHYPVAFAGDIRQVDVTGEAFFEVAPSVAVLANGQTGKRPFIVNVPGMSVQVLGTHFDVSSYNDEDVLKTTLLEGKVKVSSANGSQMILQPGEQAQLNKQNQSVTKAKDLDVDAEVAWHYGYFQFNNADLPTVMRQLSRWYDVTVVYEGNVPTREVLGKIPRSLNLSEVLDILKKLKVNFRIEGKKIIVSP